MRKLFCLLGAVAAVAAPTAATASTASIRLILDVPVVCSLDVLGGQIDGNRLTLQVHRNCNTGHSIVLSGLTDQALGDVQVHYNGGTDQMAGSQYVLSQPERYYDQTDSVVIEASDGDTADLLRFANTLQLSVVVA